MRRPSIAIYVGAVLALAAMVSWIVMHSSASSTRILGYSMLVQRTRGGQPEGQPFRARASSDFHRGWRFRLIFLSPQSGRLYLLEGMPAPHIFFEAAMDANRALPTAWCDFAAPSGTQPIWIVWSAQPLTDPESILRDRVPRVTSFETSSAVELRSMRDPLAYLMVLNIAPE